MHSAHFLAVRLNIQSWKVGWEPQMVSHASTKSSQTSYCQASTLSKPPCPPEGTTHLSWCLQDHTNPSHLFSLTPCTAVSARALLGSHLIHTRCIPVCLPPQSPFLCLVILKTRQVFNLCVQSLPSWPETVMEGYGAWDAVCNQECC